MIGIKFEVDARKLEQGINAFAQSIRQVQPLLEESAQHVLASVKQNFDTESARQPYGDVQPNGFWAELSESTKQRRVTRGTWPGKKLRDTGRLLSALRTETRGSEAAIGVSTGEVPYAKHLHFGTKKMPARPFLHLQREDALALEKIIKSYMEERIKQAGS